MNRRTFLTQCALGSAGLAVFVQGCQPTAQSGAALNTDPDGEAGDSKAAAASMERPGIDQDPPAVFETATFALG
jgi:hypothetical protein